MELKFKPEETILMGPSAGWSAIALGPFHGNLSYVQDVGTDLLKWILQYLNDQKSVVIFDEESSEFLLIMTPYTTYVISEREDTKLYPFEINAPILYNKILNDFTKHLEKWAAFDVMTDNEEDFKQKVQKNKEKLNHLLTEIFSHPNYQKEETT